MSAAAAMLSWFLLALAAPEGPAPGPPAAAGAASFDDLRRSALAELQISDPAAAAGDLARALDLAPPPAEAAKARLLLGQARLAMRQPVDAATLLAAVDRKALPAELADVLDLTLAQARAAADPGARAGLRAWLAAHPDSERLAEARLMLADAALAAGDLPEAVRAAQDVLDSRAPRDERAHATLVLARASEEPRRSDLLRAVFTTFPDTPWAAASGMAEADLSPARMAARADAFFEAMDYEEAQRIREGLWAHGDHAPRLARDLAYSHLVHVRDDARKALSYLAIAEKGGAIDAGEAEFLRARAHARLEDYPRALATYRKVLAGRPTAERKAQALYYLGWLPYDGGDYKGALPHLDRFLKQVKQHELRSYVIWAKGWSLYQLKRWKDALAVFDQMIPLGNCLVAGKAMYWSGMASRAMGDAVAADRWMRRVVGDCPLTWYAVLGAKRLKEWHGTPLPEWMIGAAPGLPDPAPFWGLDVLPADLAARVRSVKDLSDVGETARARAAWHEVARAAEKAVPDDDRMRFLLTVHDAVEEYHKLYERGEGEFARHVGRVPTPASAPYWMAWYPRAYRSLARVLAPRFGLPEQWMYSIMRQESRYRPAQVSYTAALGIMQMIPKTAKVVAKALGVPFDVDAFFEPGRNLLFCGYYLGVLLKDFKGQVVFASAAYNSGAPAIKRFLKKHRGQPLDAMVEFIAYNEGRNYCRKVAEHLVRYAYLHLPPAERRALYEHVFPDRVDYDLGGDVDY